MINYKETEPIHVDNITKAFLNLKIIIEHACWPFIQEMCGVADKRENVYLYLDLYMFRGADYQDFAAASSGHLRDRFLFVTSYPLMLMKTMVEWSLSCGVREDMLAKDAYDNATCLLGLREKD